MIRVGDHIAITDRTNVKCTQSVVKVIVVIPRNIANNLLHL